jgi:hypothetical protein
VRPRPDWPQISYGQNHARYVSRNGGSVSSALTIGRGAHILMIDHLRYDYSRFDEDSDIINYSSKLTVSDQIASSVRYEGQTWTAISWRQDKAWADVNAVASGSTTTASTSSASWAYANARASSTMRTEIYDPTIVLSSGVLLLHMNGSNGSVAFTDDSPNNWTITRVANSNGQPVISTAQSKFGGASAYFDQASGAAYLQTPSSTLFDPSGRQFTIECWAYNNGFYGLRSLFGYRLAPITCPFIVFLTSTQVRILVANSAVNSWKDEFYSASDIVPANAWSHIRLVGNGTTLTLAVNGFAVFSTSQPAWTPASRALYIGADFDGEMIGYIDELLFVHEAFQADSFMPPFAPYRIG